ncbi:lytic transglycosylase domain-containing protein [Ancylobacter lacus]|uniref:lytic transglycosylase domain-containing protein n=1 Tax=Ancylobacter lacus TaxID=2579970 RepID=UPI001BCD6335|nr:lytic transglycosylase domain-containing protein [Ancylobacter lacus]MBS7540789.1 lytic transglycosylase domain-containing protein [Ancylobacter lacus]
MPCQVPLPSSVPEAPPISRGHRRRPRRAALASVLCAALAAGPAAGEPSRIPARAETVIEALCRIVDTSAAARGLPGDFFTRLIWRESTFRTDAVSPKGAQGIAQFMPGTASERGLADPFDPESALPASARLLAELRARFGNLGLAAAAYNAGAARVERWLAGQGALPLETQAYVLFITGREAEAWADQRRQERAGVDESNEKALAETVTAAPPAGPGDCLTVTAALRTGGGEIAEEIASVSAPWGVQLSGNFSKARALASYQRAQRRYAAVLEGTEPMIIGQRLRFRGSRVFYRVRVGQPTREAAERLCQSLRRAGGACIVLPS